jgi:histidyl-tRNA synthetase
VTIGSVSNTFAITSRTLSHELHASSSFGSSALPVQHTQPILVALEQQRTALEVLESASVNRASVLAAISKKIGVETSNDDAGARSSHAAAPVDLTEKLSAIDSLERAFFDALRLQLSVESLLGQFALEAMRAEAIVRHRERVAIAAAKEREAKKAAAAAARLEAEAQRVASLSGDERAKAEASLQRQIAREGAKKAEAAPADPSDGNPNALGLGQGTHELRTFFARRMAGSERLSLVSVLSALSPYGVRLLGCSSAAVIDSYNRQLLFPAPPASSTDTSVHVSSFLKRLVEKQATGTKKVPMIAKGTRDFGPEQMEIREHCFSTIRQVFKRHGAVEIDTPVFETRETLMGKYGEEGGKLIYDLADQGGELLSLRYDLTVPFARYLAANGLENLKRFHIARVYRRDNPAMNKGRFREFYQCDFDVAGSFSPMIPDAEVLTVAKEILSSLPIGPFTIKLNHRCLLDACLEIAGVPSSLFRPICSAIDKLDKEPWEGVKTEMIQDKGLSEAVADKIGEMVQFHGEPMALLAQLKSESSPFFGHKEANAALDQVGLLFSYLQAFDALSAFTFDLSLARGLDYYTGVIYEAVLLDPAIGVGSIAAGGRYDNLVGMFSPSNTKVPCVGVSIGLERVFAIMEAIAAKEAAAKGAIIQRTPVSILVGSIPSKRYAMALERMKLCNLLWSNGFSAEMTYAADPKLIKQVTQAAESNVPYMVILAEDELDRGELQIKVMATHTALTIKAPELIQTLLNLGVKQLLNPPKKSLLAQAGATKIEL